VITLHHGDCRDIMATMDASSVDAIVTDPPYGLAFMGKDWDHGVPGVEFWREALRVAKPGAHLLAFGGTRTYHRLACAIEDAGWEIRDCVMWVYGSGFPKSHDVSKAIDKAAGAEREKVPATGGLHKNRNMNDDGWSKIGEGEPTMDSALPATDAARQWSGWGTALKPAWEPIIVARKPLCGTVAETVLRHGTGALNIDGCRAGARWPANVAHDGIMHEHGRYFYCAKASKADRDEGCEGLEARRGEALNMRTDSHSQSNGMDTGPRRNHHPTVKPTELMRYLVRLVTPPGGVVLDPFCGSGSTGRGAILEQAAFIGIELDAEYLEIARRRINACLTPMEVLL
jgi:DNA modification methylase